MTQQDYIPLNETDLTYMKGTMGEYLPRTVAHLFGTYSRGLTCEIDIAAFDVRVH